MTEVVALVYGSIERTGGGIRFGGGGSTDFVRFEKLFVESCICTCVFRFGILDRSGTARASNAEGLYTRPRTLQVLHRSHSCVPCPRAVRPVGALRKAAPSSDRRGGVLSTGAGRQHRTCRGPQLEVEETSEVGGSGESGRWEFVGSQMLQGAATGEAGDVLCSDGKKRN